MQILRTAFAIVFIMSAGICLHARIDTVYRDNGVYTRVNTLTQGWEESVILQPGAPCRILGINVYYVGSGSDTIRLTGDASEGTIPPTVWAYAYNTLAKRVANITQTGWTYIDLSQDSVILGGFDRVVVQHLVRSGAPQFGQDAGQSNTTSFYYDPLTPNANFYDIPGIYFAARGDYMVRLHVEYLLPGPIIGSAPMPPPMLEDVTRRVGLLNADNTLIKSDMASIVDVNSDGFDDVVIGSQIFINNNGERFSRSPSIISASATAWADVDNDGDPDCFAMNGFGNDHLYIQNGDGSFTDAGTVGIVNSAPAVTPLWLDYDNDGAVDLFIANGRTEQAGVEVYFPDRLFRNKKNGTFEDVTSSSGIAAAEPAPFFDTWGASVCDYNNDGRPDIFVATYRLAPDRLYRNNGDGTFSDVSAVTGVQGMATSVPGYFGHGMGSDWGDMDNDGNVDLAVGNLGHPDSRAQYSNPSLLFRNGGAPNYLFTPMKRNEGGVSFKEMNAGMCFLDLDHDGDLDLWHGQISYSAFGSDSTRYSHLYRNDVSQTDGNQRAMNDITWEMGMRIHGAWTGVRFDFDCDGDMDLLCASGTENVKLFRNDASRGNSITVVLDNTTKATATREGFGAHVVVTAKGKRYHRWLPGTVSGGRASQMTNAMHIGIGSAAHADSVVIYWSDGQITRTGIVQRNCKILVDRNGVQSSGTQRLAPRLQSPSNHAVGMSAQQRCSWYTTSTFDAVSSTYLLEASYDATFTALIPGVPTVITDTTVVMSNLEVGQTVFWRVRTNEPNALYSSVWNFTVGSPSPKAPILIAPANGATGVRTKKAVFLWSESEFMTYEQPAVTYDVEIATDTTFSTLVKGLTDFPDTTFVGAPMAPLTSYAWRVRGRTTQSVGPWSDVALFSTYKLPSITVLELPLDSVIGQPVRPRFVWRADPFEDDGYVLEYDTNATFSMTTPRMRNDTTTTPTTALKPGRRYYWRVAAKNDEGQGPWSETRTLVVEASSSVILSGSNPSGALNASVFPTSTHCDISIELTAPTHVRIRVFDVSSRLVSELNDGTVASERQTFTWRTERVPSGLYIVVIEAGDVQQTLPVVIGR